MIAPSVEHDMARSHFHPGATACTQTFKYKVASVTSVPKPVTVPRATCDCNLNLLIYLPSSTQSPPIKQTKKGILPTVLQYINRATLTPWSLFRRATSMYIWPNYPTRSIIIRDAAESTNIIHFRGLASTPAGTSYPQKTYPCSPVVFSCSAFSLFGYHD